MRTAKVWFAPHPARERVLRLCRAGGLLLLLGVSAPATAGPPPLPDEEQEQVNRAIDRGVKFLKKSQGRNGTWAAPGAPHQVGYAALPGLTLLECGVPPTDPAVQRAVKAVRRAAPALDRTYEISLAILLLDRLGDPRDEHLIETLATRLIASQTSSGGWSYKCRPVGPRKQRELLTLLRQLSTQPAPVLGGGAQNVGAPALAGGPAARRPAGPGPGIAAVPNAPLGGGVTMPPNDPLRGIAANPGSLSGGTTATEASSSSGSLRGTTAERPSPAPEEAHDPGAAAPKPAPGAPAPAAAPEPPAPRFPSARWARCVKCDLAPDDDKPAPPPPAARARAKPVVIPPSFQALPVFQDINRMALMDPPERREELLLPTSDNSNTQFAILALWAAQRHGVPMERTLRLVARRFELSQNRDGTWGYDYRGPFVQGRAAMIGVGLLGLAVGHGIDRVPGGQRLAAQDPRVLAGFVALSQHVGAPAGRTQGLPMQNLYFLWSVERVAVLYDLRTIAGKDWYRWGAEVLLANQGRLGHWFGGAGIYPGATPVIDTCFALLFLKRVNLTRDLAARLPFDPDALNDNIRRSAEGDLPKKPEPTPEKKAPPPAPKPAEPPKPELSDTFAQTQRDGATRAAASDADNAGWEEGGKRRWPYVLFGLGLLLLLGAVIFIVLHLCGRKDEVEEEEAPAEPRPAPRGKETKARAAARLKAKMPR